MAKDVKLMTFYANIKLVRRMILTLKPPVWVWDALVRGCAGRRFYDMLAP